MSVTWNDVLALDGFSSAKVRAILNRAVSTVPRARILEVGSYRGSTAAAMCHGNDVASIHLVDNHSEFGDTRAALADAARRFGMPAMIHDLDYFADVKPDTFGDKKFTVYFYDGPHTEQHQADELAVAWPHLADWFLYIVDDYSWPQVRRGCDAGIAAMEERLRVVTRNVYESDTMNDAAGYWNGLLVAWCEKR